MKRKDAWDHQQLGQSVYKSTGDYLASLISTLGGGVIHLTDEAV